MSSSDSAQKLTLIASAMAGISVVGLSLLATDAAARRLLSSDSLYARRHQQASYVWKKALEKARLTLRIAYLGGLSQCSEDDELLITHMVTEVDEIVQLAKDVVSLKVPVQVGYIRTDPSSKEYLVTLLRSNEKAIYHVRCKAFVKALISALPLTTSTFCFVTDGAAGRAHALLPKIYEGARADLTILDRPLWMSHLAAMIKDGCLADETVKDFFFALTRLHALPNKRRTVMVLMPHSNLLKVAYDAFPDDRHVYAYSGCIQAVQHAAHGSQKSTRGQIPNDYRQALVLDDPITSTVPLERSSSTNLMPKFRSALQALSLQAAQVTEAWMATVDAYLTLKNLYPTQAFLPYVCKLEFILQGSMEPRSDRWWSVRSLWQYTTGTRTTNVCSEIMDAILSVLNEHLLYPQDMSLKKAIENCAFQHKQILLENKTFVDTVLPHEHWTLLAAKKRGCACCLPEEEDEDEAVGAATRIMSAPGAFAPNAKRAAAPIGYVDGKMGFAFDPTKFG